MGLGARTKAKRTQRASLNRIPPDLQGDILRRSIGNFDDVANMRRVSKGFKNDAVPRALEPMTADPRRGFPKGFSRSKKGPSDHMKELTEKDAHHRHQKEIDGWRSLSRQNAAAKMMMNSAMQIPSWFEKNRKKSVRVGKKIPKTVRGKGGRSNLSGVDDDF